MNLTPLPHYEAKRIAFIKPSALGDVIHALPVLEAVRVRYPTARITWVVNKGFQPLIQNHPALDEILPFDRAALKQGPATVIRYTSDFIRELRKRRFDLALDLQGLLRSGLMARFTVARRRVGLSNAREGSLHCYTDVIHAPGLLEQHAVDRNWLFAEALGMGHLPKKFRVPISPAVQQPIDASLSVYARPWLALAPGARWLTKRWPLEHFAALANRVGQRMGGTVFLVGGPEDLPMAESLKLQITSPLVNLIGKTNLPQLAGWLNRMDAVVSNDSGPLHLAAALGRPVVAPYTCTRPELHGPFGQLERGIPTRVGCRGSYIRTCDRMTCMADLQPDLLWPALAKALSAWQNTSRTA